jgi:phosphoribosylanthranilate isomerase
MNDEEMTLISLDLSDRLLAFLAVYANENDMKIEEAMNAILLDYIQNHGDIKNF